MKREIKCKLEMKTENKIKKRQILQGRWSRNSKHDATAETDNAALKFRHVIWDKGKKCGWRKKNVLTVQHTPQTSWEVLVPSFSSEYPTYYDKKYGETLSFRSILNN